MDLQEKGVHPEVSVLSYVHVFCPQGPREVQWAAYHEPKYGQKSHLSSNSWSQGCFKCGFHLHQVISTSRKRQTTTRKSTAQSWAPKEHSSEMQKVPSVKKIIKKQAQFETGTLSVSNKATYKKLAGWANGFLIGKLSRISSHTC